MMNIKNLPRKTALLNAHLLTKQIRGNRNEERVISFVTVLKKIRSERVRDITRFQQR
jgi:hypothetical protein